MFFAALFRFKPLWVIGFLFATFMAGAIVGATHPVAIVGCPPPPVAAPWGTR